MNFSKVSETIMKTLKISNTSNASVKRRKLKVKVQNKLKLRMHKNKFFVHSVI